MPSVIILDTGPLSNSTVPFAKSGKAPTLSEQCRQWISDCEQSGVVLLVPAICYYEALRELERRRAAGKIRRLQEFLFSVPSRFIPLTTAHDYCYRKPDPATRGGRFAGDIAVVPVA